MNENLNLLDILEDCPKGTKLYSSVFGEVEFDSIKEERAEYPIRVLLKTGTEVGFTSDGTEYAEYYDGECVLFPSKDQRDWSKFNVSMYKKEQKSVDKIEPKFKIGDWIITDNFNHHTLMTDKEFQQQYAELPVIPKNVAERIITGHSLNDLIPTLGGIYRAMIQTVVYGYQKGDIGDWIVNHSDVFARAWLDGYVAEE